MRKEHIYYIWTKDKSGNTNTTNLLNFTIIVPPMPPSIKNISYQNVQQYGYPVNISCYVYDNVGVESVIIVIDDENISMSKIADEKGNGIYYINSTFDIGLHEFYIYATDVNGYLNATKNYTFKIIDSLPPIISNISYNRFIEPGITNISCMVRDNRGLDKVYLNNQSACGTRIPHRQLH